MVYVKHLKSRNSAIYTDSLHVHVMKLEKKGSGSPLTFNTVDNPHSTDERILLNVCDEETAEKAREKAAELKALGWSLREIAEYFSISHTAVRRLLNIPLKQQQDQQQQETVTAPQPQEVCLHSVEINNTPDKADRRRRCPSKKPQHDARRANAGDIVSRFRILRFHRSPKCHRSAKRSFVSPASAGSPCCGSVAAPKSKRRRPLATGASPNCARRRPTGVV